jgi:glycyl-tRNA synthetase beta subunit
MRLSASIKLFEFSFLYEFDEEIIQDIYDFIVSRLEMYYQEQAIDKAVVRA